MRAPAPVAVRPRPLLLLVWRRRGRKLSPGGTLLLRLLPVRLLSGSQQFCVHPTVVLRSSLLLLHLESERQISVHAVHVGTALVPPGRRREALLLWGRSSSLHPRCPQGRRLRSLRVKRREVGHEELSIAIYPGEALPHHSGLAKVPLIRYQEVQGPILVLRQRTEVVVPEEDGELACLQCAVKLRQAVVGQLARSQELSYDLSVCRE
mmetsp:Transcript_10589/g.31883  ORF Transcript_10589/g.31883 Transcript_10589/m.31883 type:complete len:208 (-) Transcript_10589:419-1042(-)